MVTQPSFYLAAVPAVILLGLSKGGFAGLGVLGMPLMALTIPPVQAAAITLPILIVQDMVSVWAYRREWDRTNLKILLPGADGRHPPGLPARGTGARRGGGAGPGRHRGGVRAAPLRRRPPRPGRPRPRSRLNRPAGWFWGAVAGFTSMIAHAGGPPFQIYVIPQRLPREVFVGTGVVFFALVNLIKVPPYLALGQFTAENLLTSAVLFPLAIAATWAGVQLVRRVSGERFYDIVYALLLLLGCKLVFDGGRWLLG